MNFNRLNNKPLLVMALVMFMIVPMLMAIGTVKALSPGGTISVVQATSGVGTGTASIVGYPGSVTSSWTQEETLSPVAGNSYSSTYIGDSFVVDVVISGVPYTKTGTGTSTVATTDIGAWFFNVNWSPSNLALTSIAEGTYLSQQPSTSTGFIGPASLINNAQGTISGGIADAYESITQLVMKGSSAVAEVAGSPGSYGVLAQLTFTVTGTGTGTVSTSGGFVADTAADAEAGIGGTGVTALTAGNNAAVTLNIPTSTLTISSAFGSPNPPVGTQTLLDGQTITAYVPSPVAYGSDVVTCTGWTGTGSAYDATTGLYTESGNSLTFVMDSTQGASTLTWNWAPASTTSPTAAITTTGGAPIASNTVYVNHGITVSGATSSPGVDVYGGSSILCPVTTYSFTITPISGSPITQTGAAPTISLTAAQVGTTPGTISVSLTVTAPTSLGDPSYVSTSTTTATITVVSPPIPTGTISAVLSGTESDASINANPGQTISIDLYISGASNVFGWTTGVTWNPAVLQLQSVTEGPYLSSSGATFFVGGSSSLFDNVNGLIDGGISDAYQSGTETAPGSSGVLVTLVFLCVAPGNGNLALPNCALVGESGATPTTVSNISVSSLFVMPEYVFGALFALGAAFAAFVAFAAFKKGIKIPTLSKRIK